MKDNIGILEEWLERIKKEMPAGKQLSDLNIDYSFYASNGIEAVLTEEIKGFLPSDNWKILGLAKSNQDLLFSLENGAESIFYHCNLLPSNFLNEVKLNYLTSIFCGDNAKNITNIEKEKYDGELDIIYTVNTKTIDSDEALSFTNCFSTIRDELYHDTAIENIIIEYKFSKKFYLNIIAIRSIKILFANLIKALDKNVKLHIISRPNYTIEDKPQQYIQYTMGALACIIGGTNFISLKEWDGNEEEARLCQNILHLLRYEAKMDNFTDVVAGSYYFENATNQMVQRIWSNIII